MKKISLVAVIGAALALSACESLPKVGGAAKPTTATTNTAQAGKATVSTSNDVSVVINAFVVRSVNGQEVLEPVGANAELKKGDIVEYQALFTNDGKDRVREMTVTLSLPQGAVFTGQTEPALGVQASLDNARFLHMPIRANHNGVVENVPFAQYQALRWTLDEIGLGATAVVKYRAQIQ